MRILHTADLHFSNETDKLVEVVRTTDYLLECAIAENIDAIVMAGDTFDEYDGRIRVDSECSRAAISFVERAANIAPVVIIRGTKSHDRDSTFLFQKLRAKHPIHVANDIEMIALVNNQFIPVESITDYLDDAVVFSLVPQQDKAGLGAFYSISEGNYDFQAEMHDLFDGFGLVNQKINGFGIPTVLVAHGMLTGCQFSTGQLAVGDDVEFDLTALYAARTSCVMLGHIHKQQVFKGNVAYSGSPGRLNFGEQEEKGFFIWEFIDENVNDRIFIPTPARKFCLGEINDFVDAENVFAYARGLALGCAGTDVRFRVFLPEEHRQDIDRNRLEQIFMLAGANKVKLEISIIPKQRTRAEGISQAISLNEKLKRWGMVTGCEISEALSLLSNCIEGKTAGEVLAEIQLELDNLSVIAPVASDCYVEAPLHNDLFA